jgi:hypothetical protein
LHNHRLAQAFPCACLSILENHLSLNRRFWYSGLHISWERATVRCVETLGWQAHEARSPRSQFGNWAVGLDRRITLWQKRAALLQLRQRQIVADGEIVVKGEEREKWSAIASVLSSFRGFDYAEHIGFRP